MSELADVIYEGQNLTWLYTPPGGYGYMRPIPVTVTKVGNKKVQVQAPLAKGGTKKVWVTPQRLYLSIPEGSETREESG